MDLVLGISTCLRTPTLTPTHLLWERGATPGFRDGEQMEASVTGLAVLARR